MRSKYFGRMRGEGKREWMKSLSEKLRRWSVFETMTQELEEYTCYVETEVTASGEQGEEGGVRDGEQAAAIFIRKPLALSFQKIYK